MTTVNIGREPKTLRVLVNVFKIEGSNYLHTALNGIDTQGFVPIDLLDQLTDDMPDAYVDDIVDAPGVYLLTVLYEWDKGDWSVGIAEGWDLVEITSVEPLSLLHAHEGIYES